MSDLGSGNVEGGIDRGLHLSAGVEPSPIPGAVLTVVPQPTQGSSLHA